MKVTTQTKSRGVDEGGNDASVIDVTGSYGESEVEDENDNFSAGGVAFKTESKLRDSGVPPQDAGLRRSSIVQIPMKKIQTNNDGPNL